MANLKLINNNTLPYIMGEHQNIETKLQIPNIDGEYYIPALSALNVGNKSTPIYVENGVIKSGDANGVIQGNLILTPEEDTQNPPTLQLTTYAGGKAIIQTNPYIIDYNVYIPTPDKTTDVHLADYASGTVELQWLYGDYTPTEEANYLQVGNMIVLYGTTPGYIDDYMNVQFKLPWNNIISAQGYASLDISPGNIHPINITTSNNQKYGIRPGRLL